MIKKSLAKRILDKSPKLRRKLSKSDMLTQLQRNLPKIRIDDQEFFVAEGDSLFDEDELHFYAAEREATFRSREIQKVSSEAGLDRVMLTGELPRFDR